MDTVNLASATDGARMVLHREIMTVVDIICWCTREYCFRVLTVVSEEALGSIGGIVECEPSNY